MQVNEAARKSCSSKSFEFRSNTKGQNEAEAAGFLHVIFVLFFYLDGRKTVLLSPIVAIIYTYDVN